MNLSIIIPNYNGEKILPKNLPIIYDSVKDYTKGFVEIIIPDDPSTDNSRQIIDKFIQSIKHKHIVGKTIENNDRSEAGFSKNVNRGVGISTGDILILLNSDVAPHSDFLTPLLRHFNDEEIFAVGCMDESIEQGEKVLRGRGIGSWMRGFLIHSEGQLEKHNTLWVSCGSGAFRRNIWDKLGGLDELFNPFYWEDIDLSYRALKSGYKTVFESKSIVIHRHETGAIITKYKPDHIRKIAYRNQFIFVWKNITQPNLILSHVLWLPYHMVKAAIRKDWVFILGFIQALAKITDIKRSRNKACVMFKKTDSEVLKDYKD